MKEGIKLLKFVLIRKVRTENAFNIAILRDILYFKLTVNSHTHLRTWKTDKKGIQFCFSHRERRVFLIQVRFLGDSK